MRKIWFGNDVLDGCVRSVLEADGLASILEITQRTKDRLVATKVVNPAIERLPDENWVCESIDRLVAAGVVEEDSGAPGFYSVRA